MKILLKSAKICVKNNPYHNTIQDILIDNGEISQIGIDLKADKSNVVKLDNLHVSLGWFDSSVSFGEPGFEERETIANGLKVATKSGFTSILLNADMKPLPTSGVHIQSLCSMGKYVGIHVHPTGCLFNENNQLAELYDMKTCGAASFGNYKAPVKDANILKIALQYSQNFGVRIQSFPFDKSIACNGVVNESDSSLSVGLKGIPNLSEILQIERDLSILSYTGGKLYIPTISTKESVELIGRAKEKGLDVVCSTAIHNIFLDDSVIKGFDSNYKVLPPLRTKKDAKALIKGIKNGVIDMVTTDHCPVNIERKNIEFDHADFGTIGLESAFGTLQTIFDTETVISLLTKGRSFFDIEEPKIDVGELANITLFNPNIERTFTKDDILSSSKNSAFIGKKIKGQVYGTVLENYSCI